MNQPHYSGDEENCDENEKFNSNHHHNNWNIDQPDPFYQPALFESCTRNEERQGRLHLISYKNF